MTNSLLTIFMLWQREVIRFYRQPSRIIGALGSPLVFWLLIGSGIGTSFQTDVGGGHAVAYLEYFFPGTLLMILLFTAIFSTFSLIEDRKEGFLQGVLVAPVPRISIAAGKILGGATLAWMQGVLFLLLLPFLGIHLPPQQWIGLLLSMFLAAFSLTGLGFIIAWRMSSIQGFHAIMNLFLIPLWLLSGALFPAEGASPWLRVVMKFNPLSYELFLMRKAFYPSLPGMITQPLIIVLTFTAVILILAAFGVSRRSQKDLV